MSQSHINLPRKEQHVSAREKKETLSSSEAAYQVVDLYGEFSKSVLGKFIHKINKAIEIPETIKEFKRIEELNRNAGHSPAVAAGGAGVDIAIQAGAGAAGVAELRAAAKVFSSTPGPLPVKLAAAALFFAGGSYTLTHTEEAGAAANKAFTASADSFKNLYHSAKDIAFQVNKYLNEHSQLSALQVKHADLDSAFHFLPIAGYIDRVYPSLDETQKNLHKYITFEVLKEYFQLDNGHLKLVKNIDDAKPLNKADKAAIKDELQQLQEQLSPLMKKYHLDGESHVTQEISSEDMQNIFISYGVKPAHLEDLLKTAQGKAYATAAAIHFKEQLAQLAEHQDCLRTFNEMQLLGGVIQSAGALFKSPALMTLGVGTISTFQILTAVQTMTGCFSASSIAATGLALGPVTMLAAGCFGLISLFMGGDSEPDQSQMLALMQLSRQIQEVYQHLNTRLDTVVAMLSQLGGMTRQVLLNQRYLSEQNRNLFRLVQSGFNLMYNQMQNLRAENRYLHKQIYDEVQYLVKREEKSKLTSFDFNVGNLVRQIKRLSEAPQTAHIKTEISKSISKLDGYLKRVCSELMNGQDEFADLEHNPRQLKEFILRHQKNKRPEDLLGLLAEEWELITQKSLEAAGVDKYHLFSTSRWPMLVAQYVELSLLPSLRDYDFSREFDEIAKQAENVEKFFAVIADSNAIEHLVECLLERHKNYVIEFQQTVMKHFLNRHKPRDDKESKEEKIDYARSTTIQKYFADDAVARKQLKPILSQIDYNRLLSMKLAELANMNVKQQLLLASLSKSSELMQQPFNVEALISKTSAVEFYDSFWEGRGEQAKHFVRYRDRSEMNEHVDIIGGNTISIAGSDHIILMSYDYRPPKPTLPASGIRKSYISQYDLAAQKENVTEIDLDKISYETVPRDYYTKDFANHAWSSSHSVTTPDGTPYLVWFTGGSGSVAMLDLKENKYVYCDNSGTKTRFSVPLPTRDAPALNTSCHTTILNNGVLIVHLLHWKEHGSVQVDTHAFDLVQKKWLPFENQLFLQLAFNNMFHDGLITSPNQFFATSVENSALVYGFVKSGKEISVAIQNRQIDREFRLFSTGNDKKQIVTENISYPVEAKEILQAEAKCLLVNGKQELFITVTFKSPDDKPKLAVLVWNPNDKKIRHTVLDLPPIHDVADWQNLQSVPTTLSGRQHLVITLLNQQHSNRVFFYDPQTNGISQLPDGPQHQFHGRAGLLDLRKKYPGFYPVQLPAPCFVTLNEMAVLYFPTIRDSGAKKPPKIELVCYPLTPLLHHRFTMTPLIESKANPEASRVTKNRIEVDIEAVRALIQASQIAKLENRQEVVKEEKPPENHTLLRIYEKAKNTFKKVIVFIEKMRDESPVKKEDIQQVNALFSQLDNLITLKSSDQFSKIVPSLVELLDALDDIDSSLKVSASGYLPGLGDNVARLLKDLSEEIDAIKLKLKKPAPSAHVAGGLWKEKPVSSSVGLSPSAASTVAQPTLP